MEETSVYELCVFLMNFLSLGGKTNNLKSGLCGTKTLYTVDYRRLEFKFWHSKQS